MRKILAFLPPNIQELSLYAYERFLAEGIGFIFIKPKKENDQDFNYSYVSGEEALAVLAEPVTLYNPEDQIIFVIDQPDGSLDYTIQNFTDKTGTPKYLYELAHIEDKFKLKPD